MTDRYESDATRRRGRPDIVEYIKDLSDRLRTAEVGLRIGHTSIEDGDLVVLNGDIRVKESDGTTVLAILHGSIPEIRMYPLGDTNTHQAAFFAFDFDIGFGPDQGIQIEVERTSDFAVDGGKLLLTENYAVLSHQPDGGEETYVWCNADPAFAEAFLFRGRFRDSWQYNINQTFYPGTINVSAGFSTWTHSYLSSFVDQVIPIISVVYNGATLQWNVDSYLQTAFTVRFGTTVGAKTITFFNVRVS